MKRETDSPLIYVAITVAFLLLFAAFLHAAEPPKALPASKRKRLIIKSIKAAFPGSTYPGYAASIVHNPEFVPYPTLWKKRKRTKKEEKPHRKELRNYNYVFSTWSKRESVLFISCNEPVFDYVEIRFGVSKEMLASVFNIETQFGADEGRLSALRSLYSMALRRPNLVEHDWAKKQLVALLGISYRNGWNPFSIRGSDAGAFGLGQSEPLSYLKYAMHFDGEKCVPADGKDVRANPFFDDADSICTAANYLAGNGYAETPAGRERGIRAYNPRDPRYRAAVLDFADYLAGRPPRHRYVFVASRHPRRRRRHHRHAYPLRAALK